MITTKIKKSLSLILSILMVFTMIPATVFTIAANDDLPMIRTYLAFADFNSDYHYYKANVVTVTFLDKIDNEAMASAMNSWDVSADQDGSVMAWIKVNQQATTAAGKTKYDVWVAGEGGVAANTNSSNLFYGFTSLVEINGLEFLDTSNVTSMAYFFEECSSIKTLDLRALDVSNVTSFLYLFSGCRSLESVNLSGWDTSNATNMGFMFANCLVIPVIDISSFNTSKVTYMERMFYKCEKMLKLYTGDGWSLESVTDSGEMFNCCYVIPDKQNHTIGNNQLPAPYDAQYANTTTGFLTYKAPEVPVEYKVTYVFEGDIPEGVTVPSELTYNEGSKVELAPEPSAEGYVFNGWTTDAEIDADGKITVNKDIVVTGSWTKLYNVTYKYVKQGDTEIPANAPELPVTVSYKAGDVVDVADLPFVEGYVFEGWDTDDAEFIGGKFEMPAKDVVISGFFKIPVEDVVINGVDDPLIIDKNAGEDEYAKIDVYVTPDNATFKEIVFESSNPEIAEVTPEGVVIPGDIDGEVTITVYAKDDPTKKDTITVIVKVPVTDIVVDNTEITLDKGKTDKVTGTVVPENATNKDVGYESSDESVVKVDENGNITAVGKGEATITVYSKDDPFVKKEVAVTVIIPITEIVVKDSHEIQVGEVIPLDTKVNEGADPENLIYETSDPSIAKVGSNGEVHGVAQGEVTITITSKDNPDIKREVTVTVVVPVEDITVDKTTVELDKGETDKIAATVKPDDATEKGVTYKSNDETVVTVDEDGNITAVGEGTTTITITSKDNPDIKREVTVVVKASEPSTEPTKPEHTVTVPDSISVFVGEKKSLGVIISPPDGTIIPKYYSSDESVVKVDLNGNITGVKAGAAVITVDLGNGDVRVIPVAVISVTSIPTKHHVCFGKTDGIGWYEVSVNGGDFFPQGPNSTLEVENGSILVVRVQDMWIDDEFDFYVNGKKVPMDAANTITVVVDGYMLIGALSMDVEVPDVDESLNIFQKIAKWFSDVINWFRNLFR